MSIQDPISDMIIRIKNAYLKNKTFVDIPKSKFKISIIKILKRYGYIKDFLNIKKKFITRILLKYYKKKPVIENIQRISKPSLKIYRKYDQLPIINNGLGIVLVSTSKGILTHKQAQNMKQGGEVILSVI